MIETKDTLVKKGVQALGWAFAIVLTVLVWLATLIGQFFGAAWYWPWLVFGFLILLIVRVAKGYKP